MDHARKHVKVGTVNVFDTNLIYSRVIGLQASGRDIDIKDILAYEIAPVPTSMVDDTGDTVEYVYNEIWSDTNKTSI